MSANRAGSATQPFSVLIRESFRDRSGDGNPAAMVGPVERQQSRLQADEGDGVRGAHRMPEHAAGVGIQSARDIEREHRAGLRVRVVDQLRVFAFDRAAEADAEQAVDHEVPADVLRDFFGFSREGNPEKLFLQQASRRFSRRRRCCRVRRAPARPCPCPRAGVAASSAAAAPARSMRGGIAGRLLDAADVLGQVDRPRHLIAAIRTCRLFRARAGRPGARGCSSGTPTASAASRPARRARTPPRAESSSGCPRR